MASQLLAPDSINKFYENKLGASGQYSKDSKDSKYSKIQRFSILLKKTDNILQDTNVEWPGLNLCLNIRIITFLLLDKSNK